MNRTQAWKNQLWNVSLLPTAPAQTPPEPPPGVGNALARPALLSVVEQPAIALARAA